MQEIESQRAAIPPVPASMIKDHLNNDDWAQQYIQDGRNFLINDNHEQIWAEIQAQEQIQHNVENLWTNDFLQQKKEAEELHDNAVELLNVMDDQNFQFSKVIRSHFSIRCCYSKSYLNMLSLNQLILINIKHFF